jgi:hypothetical protein
MREIEKSRACYWPCSFSVMFSLCKKKTMRWVRGFGENTAFE